MIMIPQGRGAWSLLGMTKTMKRRHVRRVCVRTKKKSIDEYLVYWSGQGRHWSQDIYRSTEIRYECERRIEPPNIYKVFSQPNH